MPHGADTHRRSLPFAEWPAQDRQAWEALFAEGDLFEAGPARHWRPATRRTNRKNYARWLGWLEATGALDPDADPASRVMLEQVTSYARSLMATVVPETVSSYLRGLKVVVKAMAPERDWGWLITLTNRLKVWAAPSIDRKDQMRPLAKIFGAAEHELARLAAGPIERPHDRLAVRNALMVLMLAACPLRLVNFTHLKIGGHLRHQGTHWQVRIPGAETKTGHPFDYALPSPVNPWLEHYLAEIRPTFPPAAISDALWLGVRARPISMHTVYTSVRDTTQRLLGTSINPHLFRSCAATTLIEEAPEAARHVGPLLGHRDFRTTERHYVKARQIEASRRVNDMLSDFACASPMRPRR